MSSDMLSNCWNAQIDHIVSNLGVADIGDAFINPRRLPAGKIDLPIMQGQMTDVPLTSLCYWKEEWSEGVLEQQG